MAPFLERETQAIIDAFGNHPSFMLMSSGNEGGGPFQAPVREWVARALFAQAGVDGAAAVAASLSVYLVSKVLAGLLGGLVYLVQGTRGLRTRGRARSVRSAAPALPSVGPPGSLALPCHGKCAAQVQVKRMVRQPLSGYPFIIR